jgi:hypothetical protein
MHFRKLFLTSSVCILLALGACESKEEPIPPPPVPPPHVTTSPNTVPFTPKREIKILVPDSVKKAWSGIKLEIVDKTSKQSEIVSLDIGSEYTIPNTSIKIKVGDFLPDFKMDALTITSISDKPNNPAVYVTVHEGEQEIFKGWLYSRFPSVHPFQHEKYALMLREGIRSSTDK